MLTSSSVACSSDDDSRRPVDRKGVFASGEIDKPTSFPLSTQRPVIEVAISVPSDLQACLLQASGSYTARQVPSSQRWPADSRGVSPCPAKHVFNGASARVVALTMVDRKFAVSAFRSACQPARSPASRLAYPSDLRRQAIRSSVRTGPRFRHQKPFRSARPRRQSHRC